MKIFQIYTNVCLSIIIASSEEQAKERLLNSKEYNEYKKDYGDIIIYNILEYDIEEILNFDF